jgi:hypothetical protein
MLPSRARFFIFGSCRLHTAVYVCMFCVCVCIYVHTLCVHIHTHACIHTTYLHTCMCEHADTRMRTNIKMQTQAQTHRRTAPAPVELQKEMCVMHVHTGIECSHIPCSSASHVHAMEMNQASRDVAYGTPCNKQSCSVTSGGQT